MKINNILLTIIIVIPLLFIIGIFHNSYLYPNNPFLSCQHQLLPSYLFFSTLLVNEFTQIILFFYTFVFGFKFIKDIYLYINEKESVYIKESISFFFVSLILYLTIQALYPQHPGIYHPLMKDPFVTIVEPFLPFITFGIGGVFSVLAFLKYKQKHKIYSFALFSLAAWILISTTTIFTSTFLPKEKITQFCTKKTSSNNQSTH